jgi:cytochrome c biogenesis protein CcmG, thiol:disulfide interchange protein DsbE
VRSRPARLAGVIAVIALAGCGGDDDATPAASEAEPLPTAPSTTATGTASTTPAATGTDGGPTATVSPELPEEFAGEVGPLEVHGDSLPALEGSDVESDPARGMTAPVVSGENFDGNPVRIDAAADGPTLAVFLAHWCPHCNREVPRINELRDQGAFPADLNIVGVSTGVRPDQPNWPPSQWFRDMDWTYPVVADGIDFERETFIAADAYGLDVFPFMVLIGGDGNVLGRWAGEHDPEELLELIEDNLPS